MYNNIFLQVGEICNSSIWTARFFIATRRRRVKRNAKPDLPARRTVHLRRPRYLFVFPHFQ